MGLWRFRAESRMPVENRHQMGWLALGIHTKRRKSIQYEFFIIWILMIQLNFWKFQFNFVLYELLNQNHANFDDSLKSQNSPEFLNSTSYHST